MNRKSRPEVVLNRSSRSRRTPAALALGGGSITIAAVLSPSDVERYLDRIAYAGPRSPTAAALRTLHIAHQRAVPFENLSVRRGELIVLDEKWLVEKIVARRRGGFCYELNGAFAALLDALGFRVSRLAGRVGSDGIDFDHMPLRVDFEEPWLADVGFGDSFLAPIRLDVRTPQDGGDSRRYRLEEVGGELLLCRDIGSRWERLYAFTLKSWPLSAYEGGLRYHSTSPKSHFANKTVVSRATEGGRVTVSERRLIVTADGLRTETELEDDSAVELVLREQFGIIGI
jgi:N-hydroxyarylamine O-acetyltransferase